jgi:mannosyl-3-phosphoglycerate phosphatase
MKGGMELNIASKNLAGAKRTLIIFTDLDGTLLDGATYSFDAAREALAQLRARSIPVIVVSSKTRAEIEPLLVRLQNEHPFIVENGGAVVVPSDYFPFPLTGAVTSGLYQIVALGTPYPRLRATLKEIEKELGRELRGYGDMSVEEVAARTGLSRQEAEMAKQREYDEPFIMEGLGCPEEAMVEAINARGLRCTKGDRYYHLMGPHDKGHAVRYLIRCYQRWASDDGKALTTAAIGNSLNDLPMLAAVDKPVLVQQADGSYAPGVELSGLTYAEAPGPAGWNRAILSLLQGT